MRGHKPPRKTWLSDVRHDAPPELTTPDGVQISGDVVGELAGGVEQAAAPVEAGEGDAELAAGTDSAGGSDGGGGGGLIADNPDVITSTDGEPIGNVENLSGTVWAIRTDGTKVELNVGDPVYQGDILESGPDGAVGVLLADETTFSMAENGRMVLDEMIYDPATEDGSVSLSVLQGVFTFVSGQVAKTDPDAMTLDTPVATIGIRGTQVGIEIPDGENLNVVLMEEADGFVGEVVVLNDAGSQVLNNANQFTVVQSFDLAPAEIELVEEIDMVENFAQALQHLPLVHGNQNDFGLQDGGEGADAIDGGAGSDELRGSGGSDSIEGGVGDDILVGGSGSDVLDGGQGDDVLVGGHVDEGGSVAVDTNTGAVTFTDTDGIANENLPSGDDTMLGGAGADTIVGGADYDVVDAGTGDDTVFLTNSDATIDGGAGTDTLIVAGAAADADLIINLETAEVSSGDNSITVQYLAGFENIVSGNGDDVIIGSDLDNVITGGLGDDTIVGGSGEDTAIFRSAFSIDGSSETTVTFDPEEGTITVEGPDGTDTISDVETLAFDGLNVSVIDGPTLEDTAFNLDSSGSFEDLLSNGAEVITISGVPDGAVLSAGTDNGDGTWTLSAVTETTVDPETNEETVTVITPLEDVLAGLTIMPAADSSDDFTLWIGGQDANGGSVGEASMVNMVVTGVADNANLEVGDVVGPEDTFIPLDVSAGLTDTDGSETLSISIEGIPKGQGFDSPDTFSQFRFKLSDDADWTVVTLDANSPNTFTLDGQSDENPDGYIADEMASILQTLEIKAPFNHDEDFDLTFTATVTEADGDTLTEKLISTVNVMPRADEPDLSLQGTEILADNQIVQLTDNLEDTPIALNILPESTDPSEVLSLTIGDIPVGAVIKVGKIVDVGGDQQLIEIELPVIDNMASIPMDFRDSITITPPPNSNEDFQLTVTATSTEPEAEFQLADVGDTSGNDVNAFDGMEGATEVTISGFPEGSTLSAGTDNGDGTWSISADHADALAEVLANVTLTVPEGTDEDFSLQVIGSDANSGTLGPNTVEVGVEDVSVANLTGILDIQVTGDADEVDIQINDVTGDEDTAIPLNITANLTDTDGSEVLSITITGVPAGATLSVGTMTDVDVVTGLQTWTIDPLRDSDGNVETTVAELLETLTITPPEHSDEDIPLQVTVTNYEIEEDGTVSDSETSGPIDMMVNVTAVADLPNVGVQDASGKEDEAIDLSISPAELVDTDGSETLSITISGVPEGAALTSRSPTNEPITLDVVDGSVTLTEQMIADGILDNLQVTPPDDSNVNFDLTVTATATEAANGDVATNTQTITVDVEGVADTPFIDADLNEQPVLNADGQVLEPDGSITYDLNIHSYLNDTDGSESLSLTLGPVPEGVTFNVGSAVDNGDGTTTWTVSSEELANLSIDDPISDPALATASGLQMTVGGNVSDDFELKMTATATDVEPDGETPHTDTATDEAFIQVEVANTPDLHIHDAEGFEDTPVPLNMNAFLTDSDEIGGGETLSVTIANIPDGATLTTTNGQVLDVSSGSITLAPDQLPDLHIQAPPDSNEDFTLSVTATSTTDFGDIAETTLDMDVRITGVADDPDLATEDAMGLVDSALPIPLDITVNLTDTDESAGRTESETLSINISNVPEGAHLILDDVQLTPDPDGSYTLTPEQLTGLEILPPPGSEQDFTLLVKATSTENDYDGNPEGTTTVADVINVSLEEGADTSSLTLGDAQGYEDQAIALNIDAQVYDLSETLSVSIGNIPDGAVLTSETATGQAVTFEIINGSVEITEAMVADGVLANLQITPPPDSNENFELSVDVTSHDATAPEGYNTATVGGTISVDVLGVADTPNLTTSDASGAENAPIALDVSSSLEDTDGSETLSITIANVPAGAVLSAGVNNNDGTWTLAHGDLDGLTITPPEGSEEDFTLQVTATATDVEPDGEGDHTDTASVSSLINVSVQGTADTPDLAVENAQGNEDTAIPLDIDAQATDESEVLSITIAGVPNGAVLSAGTDNGDGTWTLGPTDLTGLTITPPLDSNEDFDLTVTATTSEGGTTATATETLTVDVVGVADAPDLTTSDASGDEGAFIALDVTAALNDTDTAQGRVASETLSVTISNVPEGAVLSNLGDPLDANADGTYTLTAAQLQGLGITPPDGFEEDFTLSVTATSTENDGDTASVSGIINVDVQGTADAPDLDISDAQGLEDTAIPLNIDAQVADADEVLSLTISGIPTDAVLKLGDEIIANGVNSVTLTAEQLQDLSNLTITPPENSDENFELDITATSTEGGTTATTSGTMVVDVIAVADTPTLGTADAETEENTAVDLDIDTGLVDLDGSEELTVAIGNVPNGAFLSQDDNQLTPNPDGTYTLQLSDLTGLNVTPPPDFEGTFTLFVTSTATENENGDTATTYDVINVNVEGGADAPVLDVEDALGDEDTAIGLDISASLTDETEVLSVTIAGVPTGATLSAGAYNSDTGEWVLTPQELDGLTVTPPADSNVDFDLEVTATSTNGNGDFAETSETLTVEVQGVADTPTLTTPSEDLEGEGGVPIALDITSALTDTDGSETLSITIAGVPTGATLSGGTDNNDGTWTLGPGDLAGLTITTPPDYETDFTLTVTSTATDTEPEGETPHTDTASVTATIFVDMEDAQADPPVLVVDDAEGLEDNAIALDISASLTDPEETLSMTISGVPEGASLSLGTDQGNGVWALTEADIANIDNLTITPPLHSDVDFDLTVTAISQDGDDTATTTDTLHVEVGAVADTPTVTADDGSGDVGNFVTIEGDFGTLKMYEDGNYGYVADEGQDGETGSAGLTDPASPAEVEEAWSGIETFAFDFGTSYLDTNGQLDPSLADDTVSFNQNGIGVEGTQGGMPVPGQINHDENTGQSEALGINLGVMAATATVQVSNMYQTEDGGEQGVWQAFDADGNLVGEGVLDDTTVDFGSSSNVGTAEISLPEGAQFQYLVFTATDTGGDTNPNDSSDFDIRSVEFETPGFMEGEDLFGYTMADADGDTASATLTINVENNDVTAEPPVLVIDDVQGLEDTAIPLDVSAALTDTDGSETLSITISDVPDGVTLSAGTLNQDGSYTLTPDQLDGLTVTPPLHSNVDFDLTISATSVESASGDTNTVTETMTVDVVGVADEPPLTAELGEGSFEPGDPQVLTVEVTNVGNASAGYNNTYGYYVKGENGEPVEGGIVWSNVKTTVGDSETITLEGVDPASVGFFLIPDGFDHNPGMTDGMPVTFQQEENGIWTPVMPDGTPIAGQGAPAFFSDEALNPDDYDHMVDNEVIGNQNWEDLFGGGDNDYNDANFNATMETTGGTPGKTTFPLDIATSLVDADGSESLSVTVAGLPAGVTLSAGTDNGNGTYTLTTGQLEGLSLTVPEGVDGGFDISVTSTTTEDDGDTASVSTTLGVPEIDLVAETPELVVEDVTGDEDTAIALDISAALTDTDGSETLSVTISDVPEGVTLSAGTLNDDGSYTLTPEQLDGLTATPPADSNVDFDLTISATSVESSSGDTNTMTKTMTVDVVGVADEPTLNVAIGDPTTSGGNPQPVAYWNMNETSDQGTLADSVGDHTAETHCGLDMDDAGVFGTTAAEFNGSNDYIEVPHSDDIKPDSGAITVWFNADTVSGRGTLVSSDSSGYDTGGHFGLFVENGHLRLRMQGTDEQTNITGGDVSPNEWNQITVTWGDEGAQVYLNGEQVAADPNWTRGLEGNDNPWTFGTNQWVSGDDVANNLRDYFNGHMDDIAIFDTQLSAENVSSL